MYSKTAISTSRRVCQFLRQTSSAFSDLKKLSMADLAIGLEPMALTGSIVTIAFPAHRHLEPVVAQKLLIVVSAVLRPAICVVNAALWWPAQGDRHVQGPDCQILLHPVTYGPAYDPPREKIKDDSDINPNRRENSPPDCFLVRLIPRVSKHT